MWCVFKCMYISTCLGGIRIPPPLLTHAPSYHVNTYVHLCICDVYLNVCTYPPVLAELECRHRSWPTNHRASPSMRRNAASTVAPRTGPVCVYMCEWVCVYVCVRICFMCICANVCMRMCICVHTCTCVYVCMCKCVYVYMCIFAYLYMNICVYAPSFHAP